MKTVLIADADVGFVLWLAEGLNLSGYMALPARSIPEAKDLLARLGVAIDLLVVNFGFRSVADFVESIRSLNRRVKVVAVTDGNQAAPDEIPGVDLLLQKPEEGDVSTLQNFIAKIRKVSPPFDVN